MSAPYQKHSSTSKEAAESHDEFDLGKLQAKVYNEILWSKAKGRTCDELEVALQRIGSTIRPRLVELIDGGYIVKLEVTRPTRTGRNASVYVAPSYTDGRPIAPKPVDKTEQLRVLLCDIADWLDDKHPKAAQRIRRRVVEIG